MITYHYFAYGSNMSSKRIKARVSSAKKIATAKLTGHTLKFHKVGRDGSAKCDAFNTQNHADVIYGVIYEISVSEKDKLDKQEGLGRGYNEKTVTLLLSDGLQLNALTYYATVMDQSLKPYDWYLEHVFRGAREHGLPDEYIRCIENIECIIDSDERIRSKELSIYNSF